MQPGDFVFYETHSLSGWVIKYIQRKLWGDFWYCRITHVAFCVGLPDIVKEAIIPRVVCRASHLGGRRKILAVARPVYVNRNPMLLADVIEKQKELRGFVYGIPQIIGHLIQAISIGIFKHSMKKNPIRAGRDCVEDAYYANQDLCQVFGIPNGLVKTEPSSLFPCQEYILLAKSCGCVPYKVKR